ncbi:MAG: 4Fe-4S binding protein [Promethearchaeia archaeon]
MTRPLWFVKLIEIFFPYVKKIAKLTRIPILKYLLDISLFKGDDIIYLPKDNTIDTDEDVQIPDNMVLPSDIVKYFIKRTGYHWIMNFCICRRSMQCENYPINYGCLFLGKGILEINPKLGRRVTEQEALNYVDKCRKEGLVHMIGRNRLDAQWLGVQKGKRLLSICNCCECCCLWRITPRLHPSLGRNIKKMSGVRVRVTNKCVGCGTCSEVCFVNAIKIKKNKAIITEGCRGCGRCVEICPQRAIQLSISNTDYFNSTVNEIDELVNLK